MKLTAKYNIFKLMGRRRDLLYSVQLSTPHWEENKKKVNAEERVSMERKEQEQ